MIVKPILKRTLKWSAFILVPIVVFIQLLRFEIIANPMLNMSFRMSDKRIEKAFEGLPMIPQIKYLSYHIKDIRYLQLISDHELPYVVFIHGAPGSSTDYIKFFKDKALNQHVNIIAVDRLGYGYSAFGESETSLQIQGDMIQSVISKICRHNRIILVGHSYGGPIALKMAIDNPHDYQHVILLAPAIDPDNEKEIKMAEVANNKWSRWIVPPALKVAADEKMTHISELQILTPQLSSIRVPVCHIHGSSDSLVPYANLQFSIDHINPDLLEPMPLKNVDHFLPWSHHDLIVQKILELI